MKSIDEILKKTESIIKGIENIQKSKELIQQAYDRGFEAAQETVGEWIDWSDFASV